MSRQPQPSPLASDEVPVIDTPDIMSSVGEVVYEWSFADDAIHWGSNAHDVLGIATPDAIANGRAYARLLDPESPTNRFDAVTAAAAEDTGDGVAYAIEYGVLPAGRDAGVQLWIEDRGRVYAGKDKKPVRARGIVRVINERHEREKRLQYLSTHDALTGLHNRAFLVESLSRAIAEAEKLRGQSAFLLLAVANFRQINESYGFEVADQVLAAVARNVAPRLREQDVIGRYAGNKIGLVLHDCDPNSMTVAADRFLSAARDDVVMTDAGPVAVAASIGGVILPRHGRDAGEAMLRAEEALALARRAGHGRFVPYAHSAEREERRRLNAELANELVAALNGRRLKLAFQPVVDIATRKPVFHEALLRLETDDGEVLQSSSFIPLAEQLGLARLLDHRVLELALATLADHPDAVLSINVSGETTSEPQWLSYLVACAQNAPGTAERLIVEITETTAIHNPDEATRFVAALHNLGCRAAIDDFGAGHTSFRNLRRLGVDLVKFDGAFIRELATSTDDQLFVRTLSQLAGNFGITTVAEWVEDETAAALLHEWGVDLLQGHLVGEPQLHPTWLVREPQLEDRAANGD